MISALAESHGFRRVPHNVSIDVFEGVDEELGPLLPVPSLGMFGSLGCVGHGRNTNAILLLTQTTQQAGHALQRGGDQ